MIVAICGPPGAGKTTLTAAVRRRLDARGVAVTTLHSDEFSSRTYERLSERVAAEASPDEVWLVDGTFYERRWRTALRERVDASSSASVGVYFVHVMASLETCLERNRTRDAEESIGEQGVHVVYREFDPIDADLTVDTDELAVPAAVDRIVASLEEWRFADG